MHVLIVNENRNKFYWYINGKMNDKTSKNHGNEMVIQIQT